MTRTHLISTSSPHLPGCFFVKCTARFPKVYPEGAPRKPQQSSSQKQPQPFGIRPISAMPLSLQAQRTFQVRLHSCFAASQKLTHIAGGSTCEMGSNPVLVYGDFFVTFLDTTAPQAYQSCPSLRDHLSNNNNLTNQPCQPPISTGFISINLCNRSTIWLLQEFIIFAEKYFRDIENAKRNKEGGKYVD